MMYMLGGGGLGRILLLSFVMAADFRGTNLAGFECLASSWVAAGLYSELCRQEAVAGRAGRLGRILTGFRAWLRRSGDSTA